MNQFCIKPTINIFQSVADFCNSFHPGKGDLIFISQSTHDTFFYGRTDGAIIINYRNYGKGEPSDAMVEGIYQDLKGREYNRVIAIGGGTVLDIAKLFALKNISPVVDLYEHKLEIVKNKELILVPTTCGTGSEVTNISILELISRHTKMGLAAEELYADTAVLIPELLSNLPFAYFATSSIDALIHSIESFTSPKANAFTKMYSLKAMKIILEGYKKIAKEGEDARFSLLTDFLMASTFAGIAFGNAGCAAVHAMSYPLGATYHVPHGEANYALFTGVYKTYQKLNPDGGIQLLNQYLSQILQCATDQVYEKAEELLNHILPKKALHEYGVTLQDINNFTDTVMTKQTRLMSNNYTILDRDTVLNIYKQLY